MNLDELKMNWKAYDRRMHAAQLIDERIIVSMITERSSAHFNTVKRQYLAGFAWMLICLAAGVAILWGNPFDYRQAIQYIPIGIYTVCLLILLISMVRSYVALQTITISHHTIDVALKEIIAVYERPKRFMKYILIVFLFSQVVLFPLSFLPRNIEQMGLWTALFERLIPISIAAGLLLLAHKLGAFKEHGLLKFKRDLDELRELKTMAGELNEIVPGRG
jgi:hypothetical protein